MNPTVVSVGGKEYLFKYGAPRAEASRWYAMVELRLLDEMTGQPIRNPVTLTSDRHGLSQRAGGTADGMTGLVGIAEQVFRNIDLSLAAEPMVLTCRSPGYLVETIDVIIGPIAGYPAQIGTALPVQAGSLALHHEPVFIEGRISSAIGSVAGATVQLTEFMLGVVKPDVLFAADVRIPVALVAPCYASRAIDDQCELVNVGVGAATDKTLVSVVEPNQNRVELSDDDGLVIGDLLEIGNAGNSELIEIVDIHEIADVGSINQSNAYAGITLAHAAVSRHAVGAAVRQRTVAVAGLPRLIKLAPIRADACLLMEDVSGWNANDVIRVHSATGADEYHRIDFYQTISDGDGYFRLPAFNRLGQLSISATQGVLAGTAHRIIPDYAHYQFLVDIGVA